jgi:Zn finger protein HypA/HybF involved in hydrogenase expression
LTEWIGEDMAKIENDSEDVDALCKECGHPFKAYVDRILPEQEMNAEDPKIECPVCGCTKCTIGK